MKNLVIIFFCFGLLVLIFGAVLVGFAANEIYFLRPAEGAETITAVVPAGVTQNEIGALLVKERLVSSRLLFKLYTKWRGADTQFQYGTFEIVRGSSIRKIVNQLTVSQADEVMITMIEGWTIREMAAYLEEATAIATDDFLESATASLWQEEFAFLGAKPSSRDLEGFLFPDSYRILKSAAAEDVIRKQLTAFAVKAGEISYDDLILASIVEREVRGEQDRRMVANLFQRRLKIGMGLQADSTVNYVTGKNTPALSAEDKELDTPYNTYKYRGLPPGPISNPSLESIDAVRRPFANDYWFFLTDSEGNVHYGKTLEEHNVNKARYLR